MHIVYLLLAFGHLVIGEDNVECWEDPCATIEEGNLIVEVKTADDAKSCQNLCMKEDKCGWFDFSQFHEEKPCSLLTKECTTSPRHNPKVNSGPKKCVTCHKERRRPEKDLIWICFNKRGI